MTQCLGCASSGHVPNAYVLGADFRHHVGARPGASVCCDAFVCACVSGAVSVFSALGVRQGGGSCVRGPRAPRWQIVVQRCRQWLVKSLDGIRWRAKESSASRACPRRCGAGRRGRVQPALDELPGLALKCETLGGQGGRASLMAACEQHLPGRNCVTRCCECCETS